MPHLFVFAVDVVLIVSAIFFLSYQQTIFLNINSSEKIVDQINMIQKLCFTKIINSGELHNRAC